MKRALKEHLVALAARYETAAFLDGDPSLFMHQVTGKENQEMMAFIASCLSYGNRKQFLPKINFFLEHSGGVPHRWIASGAHSSALPHNADTFYRLQTFHHMRELCDGLQSMVQKHGSMGAYMQKNASTGLEAIEAITQHFKNWDVGHLVPHDSKSPCKRVCMFLRWLVRDGSPVDLGLWRFIDKRTLLIPLDTHVLQESLKLHLIESKTASMSTARKLTEELRKVFPDDPLKGDFALFGAGIKGEK